MKAGKTPPHRVQWNARYGQAINISYGDDGDLSLEEKDILGQQIKPEVVTEVAEK